MSKTISNSEDILDSRDIIDRIDELESTLDSLQFDVEEAQEAVSDPDSILSMDERMETLNIAREALDEFENGEEGEELKTLLALQEEAEGYSSDWKYGAQLIRDSYFKDYAQELAEDCGMLENCNQWPATCIDWDQAARELQMDYSCIEFDGVTYWTR